MTPKRSGAEHGEAVRRRRAAQGSLRWACVIAFVLTACGARTSPLDDREPPSRDAAAARDTAPSTTCEIPTASSPIAPPSSCAVAFDACRPVVESALLVPRACGGLPEAVWTGGAILVAWDGTAGGDEGDGVGLATVGVDGMVRRHAEVIAHQTDGRRPSMAWDDRESIGMIGGVTDLAWFDAGGTIAGVIPVDRGAAEDSVRIAVGDDGGFWLMAVDETQPYIAMVGGTPRTPDWNRFSGSDIRQGELLQDGSRVGRSAALLGRNPRELQLWSLSGGSMFLRYDWELSTFAGGVAIGERRITLHTTDDPAAASGPGYYLHEARFRDVVHVSDAPSGSGADFVSLDDGSVVVALPVRVDGVVRIGLFTLDRSEPASLGDMHFAAGTSAHTPRLLRLPSGFAVVYEESAGIALDVFECCIGR